MIHPPRQRGFTKGKTMKLEYTDIFDGGKRKKIAATVTVEHPSSHYGQPVVLLQDGNLLDYQSWELMGYRLISCTKDEAQLMAKWTLSMYAMSARSEFGRRGGKASTPAKSQAAKNRANLGLAEGRKKLASLTPEQRRENARKAAQARWGKK